MSRSSRATDWESKVALALGVGSIGWTNHRVSDTGVRGILTVPCSRGHGVEVAMPTKFPHDVVKKKLMQQGWEFVRSKPVCPTCVEQDKKKGLRPKPKLVVVPPAPPPEPIEQDNDLPALETQKVPTSMETSQSAIAAATTQPLTPSAKAKAARREVMTWLEESFELTGPEKGRYKAGVSDATIAKETGCAENVVKQMREDFFGILDKPKEADAILAEIGSLLMAADQLVKNADAKAAEIVNAAKAEATVIKNKADALNRRFEALAKAQGWNG